ncbi:MAG: efflux RND transporter periplasmic adaptor subunit [Myxococcota bacterium]
MTSFPVLVGLVLLSACSEAPASAPTTQTPAVQVAAVEQSRTAAASTLHAVTRASDEARLSFPVSGPIRVLDVEVGDTVTRGQVLARLDDAPLRHRLSALTASRAELVTNLEQVERDLRRLASLNETDAISAQQLEQLTARRDGMLASRDALDAQIAEAKWAISRATLLSPLDGVVTARLLSGDEFASPGAPVLSLRASDGIEVEVAAPEGLVASLASGQGAMVAFPLANIPPRAGQIVSVAQAAAPGAGLFPVRISLPDSPDLRAGLTAAVTFAPPATGSDPQVTIPLAAVVSPAGGAAVVRRVADGRVESVSVQIVSVESERVAVRGGLAVGDAVVVRGHVGLNDGEPVEVR